MPIYDFHCDFCDESFEREMSMKEPKLAQCPTCMRQCPRLYIPSPLHFRGPGFYSTDYGYKRGERVDE